MCSEMDAIVEEELEGETEVLSENEEELDIGQGDYIRHLRHSNLWLNFQHSYIFFFPNFTDEREKIEQLAAISKTFC